MSSAVVVIGALRVKTCWGFPLSRAWTDARRLVPRPWVRSSEAREDVNKRIGTQQQPLSRHNGGQFDRTKEFVSVPC